MCGLKFAIPDVGGQGFDCPFHACLNAYSAVSNAQLKIFFASIFVIFFFFLYKAWAAPSYIAFYSLGVVHVLGSWGSV